MDEALKQGASIIELDVQFHALIAQAAMNKALMLAREPISLLFYPALDKLFSHPRTRELAPRRLFEAHRFILQGLEQRDANIARDWMQRHIADFRRGYAYCGLDIDAAVDQPSNGASS
jgi:DNA-binding FadR family transcriptional regulator